MKAWDTQMELFRGIVLAAYGIIWAYLAERHDLKLIGYAEPIEGRRPGSKQKASLAELIKASGAGLLFVEPYQDQKIARRIAQKADAEIIVPPTPLNPVLGPQDYFQMFEVIYGRLITHLKGGITDPTSAP